MDNFLPKKNLKSLNKILPSYDELQGKDYFISTSQTKNLFFQVPKNLKI